MSLFFFLNGPAPAPAPGGAHPLLWFYRASLPGVIARRQATYAANLTTDAALPPALTTSSAQPQLVSTTGENLLAAVRAMLVVANVAPASAVFVSLLDMPMPNQGGPYVVITPGAWRRTPGYAEGTGRALARYDGGFSVTVVGRNSSDIATQDTIRLLAPDINSYALTHAAQDAIDGEFAEDANANYLTIEPMWVAGIGKPRAYGQTGGAQDWVGVDLDVEASYVEVRSNPYS